MKNTSTTKQRQHQHTQNIITQHKTNAHSQLNQSKNKTNQIIQTKQIYTTTKQNKNNQQPNQHKHNTAQTNK